MSIAWRALTLLAFGGLAIFQHWPAWSAVLIGVLLLIDPQARWNELLDAIKSRRIEPAPVQETAEPKPRDFSIPVRVTDRSVFAGSSPDRRVVFIKPSSPRTESEICRCGYPGCIGHAVVNDEAVFPGFTSEAAMRKSGSTLVRFDVEISGVTD